MEDMQQLLVSLEGRFTQYEKNFDKAIKKTDSNFRGMERRTKEAATKMDSIMGSAFKSIGAGLVAGFSVAGLEQIISRVGEIAKGVAQVGDEAKKAGLSNKAFQELQFVADQNRISVSALTDGMKELSLRADEWITTGGGAAAEAFQRLGFSATELKGKLKDPSALLAEIIERVGKLDKAAQIRIFDEIFGGTGGEQFVQLIDKGAASLRATVQQAHDLGIVLNDDVIKAADEIDRKFNLIATTIGTNIKSAIVETVSELVTWKKSINEINTFQTALTGGKLTAKMQEIAAAKDLLHDLQLDLAQNPGDPIIGMNIERQTSLIAELIGEADALRDTLGQMNDNIKETDDTAAAAGPTVAELNAALSKTGSGAITGASGIKTFAEAIHALRAEVPGLASDLALLDANTRIDGVYRAAVSKATTMGEVYQANALRDQALQAVGVKAASSEPEKYLSSYLVQGKTAQSLTGMDDGFAEKLAAMFASAPDSVRANTTITSGYRTFERQAELYAAALAKYGSPEAARKWVAPPGQSQHNKGNAADLGFQTTEAKQWFHENAPQNGLNFRMSHESWHIEDQDAFSKDRQKAIEDRTTAMTDQAKAYSDIITGAKEYTASQGVEQQALGMSAQKASAFRREQEMLAQAQRAGITLTDQQRQQIANYAQAAAAAEGNVKTLADSQRQAADVSRFFGEQAVDSLTGLITGTLSAEDALKNLATALIRAALQAAILGEGPLASMLGGGTATTSSTSASSGLGGLFGGLLSLFGFASGGYTGPGGTHQPAGIVHAGEFVMSAAAVKRIGVGNLDAMHQGALKGFASGGFVGNTPKLDRQGQAAANGNNAAPNVSINAPVTVNANGGTPEQNADLAKQVKREMESTMRGVVVDEIVKQMRPGNMLGRAR